MMTELEYLKPLWNSGYLKKSDIIEGNIKPLEIGDYVFFLYKRFEVPLLGKGIIADMQIREFMDDDGTTLTIYSYDLKGFIRNDSILPYGLHNIDKTMEGLFTKLKYSFDNQFQTTDFTK